MDRFGPDNFSTLQIKGHVLHHARVHLKVPAHDAKRVLSMNAFHSTNLFCCFSCYQAPANSIAPPSVYKPHTTHNSSIRSDEGLTLEMSAFESLYGG